MKRSIVWLLLACSVTGLNADEQVRSTQEELRRRNIYFGNVDGQHSGELQEALKRYQARKGLAKTGQEDRDTLRSLGIVQRAPGEEPPKELVWPEEPVLKSDTKLDVAEEAQEIADTTGVTPESVALGLPVSGKRTSRRGGRAAEAVKPLPSPSRSGGSRGTERFAAVNSEAMQKQVYQYVRDYAKALSRNELDKELTFYADRVNYLGNGTVDRRIIEQSLRRYYQRWPKRSYSQTGGIAVRANPGRGEIVVNFRMNFALKNGGKKVQGQTEHQMIINAATADPRIVSFTEQRVRQ